MCLLCLAAIFAHTAYATDPDRAMSQYIRERWAIEQGFPRGPVYAIAQSNDGYLWIGTQAGLVRFDGLSFRLVRDVPGLLNGESVLGLILDGEGSLWIRLEGSSLMCYKTGVFEGPLPPDDLLSSRISAMSESNAGDLLVSVMERGVVSFRRGRFHMVADAQALPRSPVLSVAQTTDGSIWAGTRGAGLFRFRNGGRDSISENLSDPKVNCLLTGDKGDLWVGTDNGIVRWNGTRLVQDGLEALTRLQILALERDRDGNIWAGTDARGLIRINQHGVSYLEASDERRREAVTALFEDREGNLWIGSANGLERLRDSAFVTYSRPEGLPSDRYNAVLVDTGNRAWLAPVQGGLCWMKGGKHGRVSQQGLDRDIVYSIAGGKDELWLGRQRGGLTRIRTAGDLVSAQTYTSRDGLAQDSVFSVYQARDGTVWAGTLSGGVSRLRDGRFTTFTSENGLQSNTVNSILESSDGTMWFATPAGLSAMSEGHWRAYSAKDGLPSENVNCLLEDSRGVLWVGTSAGLAFRQAKGFEAPAGAPESLREQILGFVEDRYGSLWIATSRHVLRLNREKLLNGRLGDGDVREYGLADGLRGVEGVRRHRSVISDAAGRIWFCLSRGISVVDPARLTRNTIPAIVHVQSILADGTALSTRGQIHVPGGHHRIGFGYTALSLSVPERIRFRYRLDEFDSNWSAPVSSRDAVYTNLAPGSYRFRVMASNPDGVWNSNEGILAFTVDPTVAQTWWFRVSLVLACAGAIFALYRLRMHQLAARLNLRFETRLAERTRIAQDLHDTLLQGFLSASMQVHVATDTLTPDSKAKPTLIRALQLMNQVIEEGRSALRGLRLSSSDSLDLEQAFARVPQELAPQDDTEPETRFQIVVEGQQRPLRALLRDDVYRIGREAVINAFRHAHATNIVVKLQYSPSRLRVLVRDDGCGIAPEIADFGRDGHWGLPGMRERAEQIGARLHVYSGSQAGTEVELSVPAEIAFEDHSRRKRKRLC